MRTFLVALALAAGAATVAAQDVPMPSAPAEERVVPASSAASAVPANDALIGSRSGRFAARSEPLWELGIGPAAVRFPDYRGSDEAQAYLLPMPFFAYRGRFLRADRDGARAILFAGHRVEVDLSLSAATPTKSKDNRAREGMPDLPGSFEFGPNVNVELWMSQDKRYKLDLRLPIRQVVTLERNPHAIGVTFAPNLNLDIRNFAGRWNLGLLAGPVFDDRRYHQHYYGVAPEYATAHRAAYQAPGGYAGWRGTVAFSRRLGSFWIGGFARYDDLSGATFRASPLVKAERSWQAGFGVSWIFAASGRQVLVDD